MIRAVFFVLWFSSSLCAQDFCKADSIAKLYAGADLSDVVRLSIMLTQDLDTETEKFRALHSWVCANLEYDHRMYQEITRKRKKLYDDSLALAEWNRKRSKEVWEKLYTEKVTICTGYALLLAQMASAVGIECRIRDGYARSAQSNVLQLSFMNHSWNEVKLDGQWQLCDPTWSSGMVYLNDGLATFVPYYNDGYFLAEPAQFYRNHFPANEAWIPNFTGPSPSEFTMGPLLYGSAFKHKVFPKQDSKMHRSYTKKDTLSLELQCLDSIPSGPWYILLDNGFSSREVELIPEIIEGNRLLFQYQFGKAGTYDLLVQLAQYPFASYTIDVHRN